MTRQSDEGVVLVTGASRGLGMAVARSLADGGWRVVAGARDPSAVDYGDDPRITVVPLDVTDHDTVRSAVATAEEIAEGALDALVSNAGYAYLGPVEGLEMDDLRVQFETNVFGALAVTQAVLPKMREARRGRIMVVSSVGAHLCTPLVGAYRASKAAFDAMADTLRVEIRPYGVEIIRVEPGMVATGFSASAVRSPAMSFDDGPWAAMTTQTVGGLRRWRQWVDLPAEEVADQLAELLAAPDPPVAMPIGEDAAHLAGLTSDELLDFLGVDGTIGT